jgi:hypothetical protein
LISTFQRVNSHEKQARCIGSCWGEVNAEYGINNDFFGGSG